MEAKWLEVFEGGEAVKIVTHFVVRHDSEWTMRNNAMSRNVDSDSLNASRIDSYVFLGIVVAVVGIKVDVYITPIGVVTNVLHVVIKRNGVVVVHHYRL